MRTTYAAIVALMLLTGILAPPSRAEVSFDFFYSNLSPHGSWLVSAQFGRVWQPQVYQPGWNPYYDGHWEDTDLGWTWVSDYAWGAVPYHYGTWISDPALGWVWVPGTTWAPAWVVFRTGPEAIGWAPVAPGFSVGASLGTEIPASGSFLFVSTRDFAAPRIRSCIIPEERARTLVRNTTVINNLTVENNIVVNRGPDVHVVERASGRSIRVATIESVPRVSPFAGAHRAELAVAPGRAVHGVPAAEPVSARRPLPSSGERAAAAPERDPRATRVPSAQAHEAPSVHAAPRQAPQVAPKPEPPPAPNREAPAAHAAPHQAPQVAPKQEPPADHHAKKPARPAPKKDTEPHKQPEGQGGSHE